MFEIRCPQCHEWSTWSDDPETKVVETSDELQRILQTICGNADRVQEAQLPPKLLTCQSKRSYCPASFDAVVCKEDKLVEYSRIIGQSSWSAKRQFRLYKNRRGGERWPHHCAILFNSRSVPRHKHLELEALMDRELLSRLLTGMSTEINAPLTLFSAAAFPDSVHPQSTSDAVHWIPVEVYSNERQLVPPRFSRFCKVCREISMKHVTRQFYTMHHRQECPTLDTCITNNNGRAPCRKKHFDVNQCTNVQYQTYPRCECPRLDGDQCKGRDGKAPCREQEFDLNQCPEVLELRKKECVCYHSDISLIETLVQKWKNNAVPEVGERLTCPTDGGRGASLIDWAAIDTKGTIYGRQEYTSETLQ